MIKEFTSSNIPELRLLAWEITSACNLACKHCRAEAKTEPDSDELSTQEAKDFMDDLAEIASPILIFTGGEPLMREDIFELVSYGNQKGLKCVMAVNGTLLSPEIVRKIRESGIQRVSVSLDGADRESHDSFRGVPGAYDSLMQGIENLKQEGVPFQINTTVTQNNLESFQDIFRLAEELGAVAWHIFLLVPTGRANEIRNEIISAEKYEQVLNWFYDFRKNTSMQLKATCAPHYHRILRQRAKEDNITVNYENFGLDAVSKGCLGGLHFCFVSSTGQVQPCGYLELDCGQLRSERFSSIWASSPRLQKLRDPKEYKGKCGSCEYHNVCGGCRARAMTMYGDYLMEEPLCTYQPEKASSRS